jgi:hypothetical protein
MFYQPPLFNLLVEYYRELVASSRGVMDEN